MAFTPFPWKNKGEPSPTKLNRQNLNAAEEALVSQVTPVAGEGINIAGNTVAVSTDVATSVQLNVQKFGAVPGTDCTTAVLAAITGTPATDITVYFPAAASGYKMALGQIGASGVGEGRKLTMLGDGPTLSVIEPRNATESIFKVSGRGDASDDWFEMDRIGVNFTEDRLQSNPVIDLRFIRNFRIRVRAAVEARKGLLFRLESSYQGHFECDLRCGKGVVPMEFLDSENTPSLGAVAQLDTFKFGGTVITGCAPIIFRNASKEIHGVDLENLKCVQTVQYPTNPSIEAELETEAAAGATSLVLKTEPALVANDVVCVGMDGNSGSMDYVTITSVAGKTLTLHEKTPLRFKQLVGAAVLQGGMAVSIGDAINGVSTHSAHFEGHQVGLGLGSVHGVEVSGWTYQGTGLLIRVNGNASEVSIPSVIRRGTTVANKLLERSAQAYGTTDGNWTVDRVYVPASRPVAPATPFPHNTRNWDAQQTNSSQLSHNWNAEANQGTAKRFIGSLNGTEKFFVTYGGTVFVNALAINRLAKAISYEITSTDATYLGVTSTTAAREIKLPLISEIEAERLYLVKDESIGAASHFITLKPSGENKIDKASSLVINTNGGAVWVYNTGTEWSVISNFREVAPSLDGVIVPIVGGGSPLPTTLFAPGTAFKSFMSRAIVPKTGLIKDLSIYNGTTVAGSFRLAIYDVGEASSAKYSILWEGAETAMSGESKWQTGGAPELAVNFNQQIMLAVMTTSTTATFGSKPPPPNATAATLPASYLPISGGASPKVCSTRTFAELKYAEVTEANMLGTSSNVLIIGRVE